MQNATKGNTKDRVYQLHLQMTNDLVTPRKQNECQRQKQSHKSDGIHGYQPQK